MTLKKKHPCRWLKIGIGRVQGINMRKKLSKRIKELIKKYGLRKGLKNQKGLCTKTNSINVQHTSLHKNKNQYLS
jgi:hypothetical protein